MTTDDIRRWRTELALLLGLAEAADAERAAARLGLSAADLVPEPVEPSAVRELLRYWRGEWFMLWMLERDDPELNAYVYASALATDTIRRDILRGVPFGPGNPGPVPVHPSLAGTPEPRLRLADSPHGVIGELRRARTMGHGRSAAALVSREHWDAIAAADRAEPLPGYARWNLCVRIDCPPSLRAQFGSHPKFTRRLLRAGVIDGPREYVSRLRPARKVLTDLDTGRAAFPHRLEEARETLAPLVREHLGPRPEAWAVCAQLLPTFAGTVPELIGTAGAIAG
ncbi:hypothetical protein [Streptomyces sp. NPDC003077]|uniref:hypothetical protein n=1 Tax=Streptomyces sp. NPDC003077 TaxID=3154443 RepID=UPI0033A020FE